MTQTNAEKLAALYRELAPSLTVTIIPGVAWSDHIVRVANARIYRDLTRYQPHDAAALVGVLTYEEPSPFSADAYQQFRASLALPKSTERPVFGVTPPPKEQRGCMDGGGRMVR